MRVNVLPRNFYKRSPLVVAPDLLGKVLCYETKGIRVAGKIIEVEAYLAEKDPASHSFRGKTKRNATMFGPPGFAYLYFIYGNHICLNVVTEEVGKGSAILIRALEPLLGIDKMIENRKKNSPEELTSGPGKLTQAFGLTLKANGLDLTKKPLWICEQSFLTNSAWVQTPRIGISQAKNLPYRFLIPDSRFVSRSRIYRP